MPKSDSAIKNNYVCILVEQMWPYRKKCVDSITAMMVIMMISYFVFAVGFLSLSIKYVTTQ